MMIHDFQCSSLPLPHFHRGLSLKQTICISFQLLMIKYATGSAVITQTGTTFSESLE